MYGTAARFYDLIHDGLGRDARAEAELVIGEVRLRAPRARSLLDLGCGTGAHLPRFTEDFDVVGVDLSPQMLALAAKRLPGAILVEGDFRSFRLNRKFDVAVSLFSGIGYLTNQDDLRAAVANIAAHLNPGGVLLTEGWVEPDYWIEGRVNAETGRDSEVAVARVVRSSLSGMICEIEMRYTVVTPAAITSLDEQHRMRLSDPSEFADAYLAAGLDFGRLPHMLHPGRSVYAGVKTEPSTSPVPVP
jgi:SAM-dependent methyltransferase